MDEYKAILERMKQQRADLDQAIAAMERLVGASGNGSPSPMSSVNRGPLVVTPDAFFGLSLIEAAKSYLRMAGKPARSTDEILNALKTGGSPEATKESLGAVLARASKGREIRKVGKGMWGLGEWYPMSRSQKGGKRQAETEEETEEAPEAEPTGEKAAT